MNTVEFHGNLYNLDNADHKKHLEMLAAESGLTLQEMLAQNTLQQSMEKLENIPADKKYTTIDGIELYEDTVPGTLRKTLRYVATGEEINRKNTGEILPPKTQTKVLENTPAWDQSFRPDALPKPAADAEELPLPAPETAPASEDDAFKAAMMQYYRDKDAQGGTKLAEWAGHWGELAAKNYRNVLRRNPELANPGQAFKDSWVSEAFGQQISASNAQLPDFEPGSSNLNYSLGDELSKFPDLDNAYTDFSRNNINPGEVTAESELKGFDFPELIKEFDYRKLL